MRNPRNRFWCGAFLAAGLLTAAFFSAAGSGAQPASSNRAAAAQPASQDAEKEVKAAVADLIVTVEKRDFRRFYEFYAPVDVLRDLRRGPGVQAVADQAAERAKTRKAELEDFLKPFRAVLKVKPKFNTDKTEATFEIIIVPEQTVSASRVPILAVRNATPKITGYGLDLNAVIKKATADLEAGKAENYFNSLLPVSELKLNAVDDLAKRFKASPAAVKQAIADLKSLQGKKPKLEDGGSTAVFTIPVPLPKRPVRRRRGREEEPPAKIPPRVFKFQKTGGHWRLYDNTTALQTASKGFSRKIPAETKTVVMEKIGSNWRIAPDGDFGGGRSSRRKSASRAYKSDSKSFAPRRFREKTEERKTETKTERR